jgi:rhomboid protease GluP
MPDAPAIIHARSRREAMDWSLVLASQGIDTWIEQSDEGPQWALVVETHDYDRALAAIRQYRLENRGWPWKYKLPLTGTLFHWGSVVWCAYLASVFWINAQKAGSLELAGVMDKAAVLAGQWWRLFTAVSLHSGVAHLAANLTFGFLLLGLAMARYGAGVGLLAAYLAGGCGNVAALLLYEKPFHGLGASGMVMGGLGLLAVQSLPFWRRHPRAGRFVLAGALASVMLFVWLGLDPTTDVVAHAGGFVGGSLLGGLLGLMPQARLQRPAIELASLLLLGTLVGGTWWLALRQL